MSGQSCCITIAVFLIILQQIPPGIGAMKPWPAFRAKAGKKSSGRNRCGKHFPQFSAELKVINPNNRALSTFTFQCTAVVIANVLSATGELRCCRRSSKAKKKRRVGCQLRSDFMVDISVVRVDSISVQNCTLTFSFIELTGAHFNKTLELKIFPGKMSTSTFFVNGKPTRFLSSYVTHTVFPVATASRFVGQPFITSSIIVDNSTMHSTKKISSTVVKRQPSPSFVPSYTRIVTIPSITESLSSKPLLMTSSLTESLNVSITSIQASATTRFLLTSTTLSLPGREKMKKLKQDIEFINNVNISTVKISDKNAIDHVLDAAANLINTNLTTEDQKEDPGMKAVEVLEELGNSISRQLDLGNNKSVTFEKVTEDLVFGVAVINATTSPGFIFPSDDIEMTGSEKINIPTSVFVSDKSYFVGIIFKAYREMRNNTGDLNMGTKVISAVVSPRPSDELEEPVEMTFEKNIVGPTLAQKCSFWIENDTRSGEHGRWSTRQCFKTYENESHIKCACSHFTNFAVLFQVSNKGQHQHEEHSFRLVLITYIGLGLSILGCLLTFIIYVALSNIKSDRATVHKNLVFALGIADVIFLVTVVFEPDGDSCTAAAMLAFFFYLAVFFWMLVEGVYIYLMVIKVFRGNVARRRRIAYIVGWGCPVIIAVVTWVIFRNDVASKYHCWLSVQSGAIWAFVGPGLAIIFTNLIILIAVMKTTWTTFADDKEYGGLKSATKTFGAVIPILGITWVFGVMAFNDSSIVFQYIFAIVNSIQGALIFILYCIVNNEVRTEINRRIVVWRTRRELSVSGGQRSTYPYIMSFEGNASLNRTTTSAVGNTDLFRHALLEIEEVPASAKVEKDDSSDKTSENDFELGVKADKDGGEEKEGDEGSGRSSPLELNVELNDDCDKSTQF